MQAGTMFAWDKIRKTSPSRWSEERLVSSLLIILGFYLATTRFDRVGGIIFFFTERNFLAIEPIPST
uniref:Uncharacterized protein n=1 Tax=Picea glauca TaxID=3330 RepID=A0A117NG20_PICGL|nr:hypothetical protein ABT39_MTgene1951 [Picea glauca]QHR92446.1 hypothetical protein Q903MT_gene6492 [Picea sitchensis]